MDDIVQLDDLARVLPHLEREACGLAEQVRRLRHAHDVVRERSQKELLYHVRRVGGEVARGAPKGEVWRHGVGAKARVRILLWRKS